MSMFDSVRLSGSEYVQLKCFGCHMTEFALGDAVTLIPRSRIGDDVSWIPAPATFQVALSDGSFLTVLDGRLRCRDRARRDGLPVVDSYGVPWSGDLSKAGTVLTHA